MRTAFRNVFTLVLSALAALVAQTSMAEDFGVTTVHSTNMKITDVPRAMLVMLLADGDLESISAYIKGPDGDNIRVALYEDNSGAVGALLAESTIANGGPDSWHWEIVTMPSVSLTAGNYWVVICTETDDQKIMYQSTGETGSTGNGLDAVNLGFADPWSEASSNSYSLSLYASTAVPAAVVTPFVAVETTMSLDGNTGIGTYGTDPLVVATNSTTSNDMWVDGASTIQGDAYVGVGGDVNTVINVSSGASITGTTGHMASAATIPNPSEPVIGGGPTAHNYTSGITTISSDVHASSWSMGSGGIVQISGSVVILVESDFTMEDKSRIQLSSGASLSIYVKGDIDITDSAAINTVNADPSDFTLVKLGTGSFSIHGNAQVYANAIAHDAQLSMSQTAFLYGSFEGDSLQMIGSAWIYASGPGISIDNPAPILTQWREIDPN